MNKETIARYHREWRKRRREQGRTYEHPSRRRVREMLIAVGGNSCWICGRNAPGGRKQKLCIDHCHKTGKIRGLLCDTCNRVLGRLERIGIDRFQAYLIRVQNSDLGSVEVYEDGSRSEGHARWRENTTFATF
jgi:hypothetical protein